jgi:hypothetical protein
MSARISSRRKQNRFGDLFFIRRFPKRQIDDTWERPTSETEYKSLLESDDFMTLHLEAGSADKYPNVVQDLKDMDEHLLIAFFEFSQKAKYFQNMFYGYQWLFIVGTLVTTMLGVYTTHTFTTDQALASSEFKLITLFTSLVSAAIAAFTARTNRYQPQRRWAQNRRSAEDLRMHYFLYLSHLPPYHQSDRLDLLRRRVVELRELEEQDV